MKVLLWLLLILSTVFPAYGTAVAADGKTQVIDRKEMEQILGDFLAQQSAQMPHVEFRVSDINLPEPYEVPQGRIEHEIIPAKPGVIGSRRVTLMTRVDGQTVSNQSIRIDLEALAEVAVAAAPLRRGQMIGKADVELRYLDISRLDEPAFSAEELVGQRLKRSVRLGDPLEKQQVEYPPVIKRGERVTIQASGHGLMLTAAGEAKQDGRPGEAIRVMNSNSRKEILCQVVAPGLVQVEF